MLYKVDFRNPWPGLMKQVGMSYSDTVTYKPGEASLYLPNTAYAGYMRVRPGFAFRYDTKGTSTIAYSTIFKLATENFYNTGTTYGHKYHLGAEWVLTGAGNLFLRLVTLRSNYEVRENANYEEPYREDTFPYWVRSNYTRTIPSSVVLVPDTWYWIELTASLGMGTQDLVNPFFKNIETWGYPNITATTKINGNSVMPAPDLRSLIQPLEYRYYINNDKTVGETITQFGGVIHGNAYFADVVLDTGWDE